MGSESGLGIGFGGGIQITKDLSAEINYESYNLNGADLDLLGVAFRQTFWIIGLLKTIATHA